MESIIEELYYGNVRLSERNFRSGSEFSKVLQLVVRHEDSLDESLNEEQKEVFHKFKDCTAELNRMTEINSFALGFKLGLRLTAETFISGNGEQDLTSE